MICNKFKIIKKTLITLIFKDKIKNIKILNLHRIKFKTTQYVFIILMFLDF
jgi:hypothetical protein